MRHSSNNQSTPYANELIKFNDKMLNNTDKKMTKLAKLQASALRRILSSKRTLDKTTYKANLATEEVQQEDAMEEVKNAIAMLEEGATDSDQGRTRAS